MIIIKIGHLEFVSEDLDTVKEALSIFEKLTPVNRHYVGRQYYLTADRDTEVSVSITNDQIVESSVIDELTSSNNQAA